MRHPIPLQPTAVAVDDFVDRCLEAFGRACANEPPIERHLSIADRNVVLRISAPEIARRFEPATRHVEIASGTGGVRRRDSLTIGCWDTRSTGVELPPLPWGEGNLLHRDRVRGHTTGAVRVTYQESEGLLHLYDSRRGVGLVHATSARAVPDYMDRAPFRAFLGWWSSDQAMSMMHASCVAIGRDAALIAGASGSGKSTTAMTCGILGFDFLCDDVCVVELNAPGGPLVHGVYGRSKLEESAVARLGLTPAVGGGPLVIEPARPIRQARARVLLVPELTGRRETVVEELPKTAVMRVLVPSSIREGGGLGGRALQEMTRVVDALPCQRILLGTDLVGVAAAVAEAIEEAVP